MMKFDDDELIFLITCANVPYSRPFSIDRNVRMISKLYILFKATSFFNIIFYMLCYAMLYYVMLCRFALFGHF